MDKERRPSKRNSMKENKKHPYKNSRSPRKNTKKLRICEYKGCEEVLIEKNAIINGLNVCQRHFDILQEEKRRERNPVHLRESWMDKLPITIRNN